MMFDFPPRGVVFTTSAWTCNRCGCVCSTAGRADVMVMKYGFFPFSPSAVDTGGNSLGSSVVSMTVPSRVHVNFTLPWPQYVSCTPALNAEEQSEISGVGPRSTSSAAALEETVVPGFLAAIGL